MTKRDPKVSKLLRHAAGPICEEFHGMCGRIQAVTWGHARLSGAVRGAATDWLNKCYRADAGEREHLPYWFAPHGTEQAARSTALCLAADLWDDPEFDPVMEGEL